ncbi:ArdC-like ssDNA-binding domain-containing protein [Ferrimicrobium acidiphilum]|jgi:hypothetical protein|uniref:ArdC-like ssDNA-binding domain-containing protein n=1 Tax=Ferrimicrobium acidiphilum TaxID=121039 RepID=UPI0023F4F289|nr:ArdC-like ssDNA-binding domain-containing protein [Ferrimicrobium acidiphilum]
MGNNTKQAHKPKGSPGGSGGQFDFVVKPADKPDVPGGMDVVVASDDGPDAPKINTVQGLMDELKERVQAIDTHEQLNDYLDFYARFYKYSPRNAALIYMQKPEASFVASYKKLLEEGFQVKKGEKAIRILAPVLVEDDKAAPDPATGKKPKKLVNYRSVPVFDVSQCDELPGTEEDHRLAKFQYGRAMLAPGDVPDGMEDALKSAVESYGYKIRYEDRPLFGVIGYTSPSEKIVMLPTNASPAGQMHTLAHELGHIMMEHDKNSDEYHHGTQEAHQRMEIEAESISHILTRAWGLSSEGDANNRSDLYVHANSATSPEVLQEAMSNVIKKAGKLPMPQAN